MKNRCLRIIGIIFSIVMGIEMEFGFYMLMNITPQNVPLIVILSFWCVNSILTGCIVDEIYKKKLHIRLIKRKIIALF